MIRLKFLALVAVLGLIVGATFALADTRGIYPPQGQPAGSTAVVENIGTASETGIFSPQGAGGDGFGHTTFGQFAMLVPTSSTTYMVAGMWQGTPVATDASSSLDYSVEGIGLHQVSGTTGTSAVVASPATTMQGVPMDAVGSYCRIKFAFPADLADEPRVFAGMSSLPTTITSSDAPNASVIGIHMLPADAGVWRWAHNQIGSGGWTRTTTGVDHFVGNAIFNLEILITSTSTADMTLSDETGAVLASTTVSTNMPATGSVMLPSVMLTKTTADATAREVIVYGMWYFVGK